MSNNLSSNLCRLMDEVRINESELSRRTGVGQPVINRIKSGATTNPKVETVAALANFFSVSISQLIGHAPFPEDRIPGTFNKSLYGWRQVPVLSWKEVLKWPFDFAPNSQLMVTTDENIGKNAYAIIVNDASMEPRFPEKTILIIDPSLEPQDRDFVVVHIEGEIQPVFKQLLNDGHSLYLKPLNPDFITRVLDVPHKFLGVMVQARMDFPSNLRQRNS